MPGLELNLAVSTLRLYQTDSYEQSFESQVLRVIPAKEEQSWLLLKETLFYPSAGGQPHDTGQLAGAVVLEVKNQADEVWHRLKGSPPKVGERVKGIIDWQRRYRHMQRHSAQHLLSQAFLRVNEAYETKSVGLNSPVCTIDFAGEPDEDSLQRAEFLANEAVYANYQIYAFEVCEEELSQYQLRRPPKVSGKIRLVQMGDWELAACGGTHLRSSAEAGPIKLLRLERVRTQLSRVYFVAGWEALKDYGLKHRVSYDLALQFSSQIAKLPKRVKALENELSHTKRQLHALEETLATALAQNLVEQAETTTHGRLVTYRLEPGKTALLRPLAQALTQYDDVLALLGTTREDSAQLLFCRGQNVSLDVAALLKDALPLIAGRGGGKPDMAQGGGKQTEGLSKALLRAADVAKKAP